MKLISLHIQNFRQHADSAITFAPDGITAIVGANESGKSTILEAIGWALFGARATRGTMRGLRWHRAPARHMAAATLGFEVGGCRYRVERTESNARLVSIPDGGDYEIVEADGTDAVNRHVPELLGMRLDEFRATYMAQQKDLARMSAMGPTERQAFVRGVLGLDRIDAALKACRARKNDLARERDGLAAGLGDREHLSDAVEAAAGEVVDASVRLGTVRRECGEAAEADRIAQAALAESQKRADRHVYLTQNERHLRTQIETSDREIERVEHERQKAVRATELVEQRSAPLTRLPELRERCLQLIREQSRASEREQAAARVDELDSELARLDERSRTLRETIASFDETEYATLDPELQECWARRDGLARERAASEAQARQASDQASKDARKTERKLEVIRDAGEAGACPTCTRALGETYPFVVESLEKDLSAARGAEQRWTVEADRLLGPTDEERQLGERITALRGRLEQTRKLMSAAAAAREGIAELASRRDEVSDQRRRWRAHLADMAAPSMSAADIDRAIYDAGTEVARLEALERELVPLRAQASHADALAGERNERVAARADTVEHIGQVLAELKELAFDAAAHERIVQAAREASERRQAADVEAARAEEAYHAAQAQCERAERALTDYDARAGRLEELTRDLRTHTAAAERLDAFRVAQASTIRPELEELTTGFVSLLTDGRHDGVTITEDFELILSESGVDTEIVSGGTEDIAALAIRLAISQMIAMRAGHPLSLLVLDEPFGSLDAVRRANVMALIRRLRGIFQQVLLISHIEETRDSADHVIEIEYDESAGCSRVIHATAPTSVPELEAVPA